MSHVTAAWHTIDISPSFPVVLGAGRNGDLDWSVDDSIEINMVAIWVEDEDPIILISCDLLYPGPELNKTISTAFPGIDRDRILLSATHTHCAPMTDTSKPLLGKTNPNYLRTLLDTFQNAGIYLMNSAKRHEVTVYVSNVDANHSINRRLHKRLRIGSKIQTDFVDLAPNFHGSRDELITLIELRDTHDRTLCGIWNYACHPVGYPYANHVSAHFPGVVRDSLRGVTSSTLPVVYLQGFSGDTRPNATVTRTKTPETIIRRLLQGASFSDFDKAGYDAWTTSLAARVLSARKSLTKVDIDSSDCVRLNADPEEFTLPPVDEVTFQKVSLLPWITIVGVSAEVVSEYSPLVRNLSPTPYTMCVGCLDNPFGYLPTQAMLLEGGYESDGYCKYFSLASVATTIEKTTRDTLEALFI